MNTLIILNPHSGGGRAGKIFHRIEPQLTRSLGDHLIAVTHSTESIPRYLQFAAKAGITRIIALGGDGTNFSVLNALADHPELKMEFGTVPMGTGRDWARSLGIPVDPYATDTWLGRVRPVACDLGKVDFLDITKDNTPTTIRFLNVASTGITRDVVARVNRAKRRTATTFLSATLRALMTYRPQTITVECDGRLFFEGKSYMLAVANGRSFGRGMLIAPHAILNDGKFDVIVVEHMSALKALTLLPRIYRGTHVKLPSVHSIRARDVRISSKEGPIDLDLDGEEGLGTEVRFSILPKAVTMLLDPARAAVNADDDGASRVVLDEVSIME